MSNVICVEALIPREIDSVLFDDNIAVPSVSSNVWYADAYKFAVEELLLAEGAEYRGTLSTMVTNYDFIGDRLITRSDVVVVLDRFDGSISSLLPKDYKYSSISSTYVDVPDGQYYTGSVHWATAMRVTYGVGGAYFAPDRNVTREEFVTTLYRYAENRGDVSRRTSLETFSDSNSVSSWTKDAMSWAVAEGLISGKPGNLLAPTDLITKAELVTIIYRFNNIVPHIDSQAWGEPD